MSSLGETLRRVGAAHPELRMAPLADRWPEERIFYRSDHYNFALRGVPVLFFTSGTHADYHQPTDVAERIDGEKASRLVRLVFSRERGGRQRGRAAPVESREPPAAIGGTMTPRRCGPLAVGLALAAGPLAAQAAQPAGPADAVTTISASDVARRIGIIAHDSMLGRDTPSRGLELTAQYVADQFRRFGLEPGGDRGTWFQRYPITRRRLELAGSKVLLRMGSAAATAPFDRSARFVSGEAPREPVSGPAVLVGGAVTPEAVSRMNLGDKIVLYVHDYSKPIPGNAAQVARAIRVSKPRAIVSIANVDSAVFAARIPKGARRSATGWTCGSIPRRRWK